MSNLLIPMLNLWQQEPDGAQIFSIIFSLIFMCFGLVLTVFIIIGLWKMFEKADKPGWASLIPIYNIYVLIEIAGRPWWWLILMLIPFVNIIVWLLLCIDVAKSFGKDAIIWGVLLLFILSGVGFVLLGFSDAAYEGPAAG